MATIRVTLDYLHPHNFTLLSPILELPAEVPVGQLLRRLVIALKLMEPAAAEKTDDLFYQLVHAAGGEPFAEDKNLSQCGVVAGERLKLLSTASLIAPSGHKFLLTGERTRLGRPDGAGDALIDLSPVPGSVSVHRTHALIERDRGDWLFTVDSRAKNRTQVNGSNLRPGQSTRLKNGDQIRLGRVVLQFVCG